MGAGGITSNLKSARDNIILRRKDENYNVVEEFETGLRKIGAFMGDYVEVGCNSVLCPGTIIGPHTSIISCAWSDCGKFYFQRCNTCNFKRLILRTCNFTSSFLYVNV